MPSRWNQEFWVSSGKKKSSCAFRLTKSRTVVISPMGRVLPMELFMGPYQIVRLFLRLRFCGINRGMGAFVSSASNAVKRVSNSVKGAVTGTPNTGTETGATGTSNSNNNNNKNKNKNNKPEFPNNKTQAPGNTPLEEEVEGVVKGVPAAVIAEAVIGGSRRKSKKAKKAKKSNKSKKTKRNPRH